MTVNSSGHTRSNRIGTGRLLAILAMIASVVAALPFSASAQDGSDDLWQLGSPGLVDTIEAELPSEFQAVTLNRAAMAAALASAPIQDSPAAESDPLEFTLPTPDGAFERFAVEEAIVLSDELAAQYPEIKSYRGQGLDDATATVVFTQTPLGLKAQVRAESRNWYVTPQTTDGTTTAYMSFTEENMPGDSEFSEPALEEFKASADIHEDEEIRVTPDQGVLTNTGTQLRVHRIAFSTTGAYSAQFGDNDTLINASAANLVTFLNGIYEPELTVRFVLANTIIFKEPTPRPATASCSSNDPAINIVTAIGAGGGFAVEITSLTPHLLTVGDTVTITGSDPAINGDQLVIGFFNSPTRFFINNGAAVNSTTGTFAKKVVVIDPPYCDPFVPSNPSTNLGLNQPVLDDQVGDANYDIGHVLGYLGGGGSGVAAVGVVGETGGKARGASHASDVANPIPTLMHIIIRHEIGHQYGSSHTYNGSRGNCGPQWGGPAFAVEPASGSTIMSYGGICQGDNIVFGQDVYFSALSLEKFNDQLASVGLAGGAATGNNPPVVSTTGPWTIPTQTPFILMGSATDDAADAGNLTYVWEQMDFAPAQNTYENPNSNTSPLFRSLPPTAAGANRTIPSLDKILVNNTNAATGNCPGVPPTTSNPASPVVQCFVEFLPTNAGLTANRAMNFRLTARDNRANGGGVGATDTTVTVVDGTGPFLVTAPNTAVTWAGNSSQTVTWNVAGTTAAPISAANVDIAVSTDAGTTWTTVAPGTPNDGTQSITVPNVATTQARVRVMGSENIFFDISDVDFTITGVAPDAFTALSAPCLVHDTVAAGLGPLVPGVPRTVQVTGACTVPAGASSVVIGLSAINPIGTGNLRLSAAGVVPAGGVVNYTTNGLNNINTVTVPLSAAGAVDVASNNTPTDARLVVIGYYSATGTLRYVPLTPCTVSDSRTDVNPAAPPYAGPFTGGSAFPDIKVLGTFSADQGGGNTDCGVPTGANAVVLNAVSIGATGGSGGLALGTGGTNPTENTTNFAPIGLNNSAVAIVPMVAGAQAVSLNITTSTTTPTTHVRLVVLGYMTTVGGQDYTPVNPCAAFDSRTTVAGDTNIPTGIFAGKRTGGDTTAGPVPGTTTYRVTGAIPAAQGGELACGVPGGATAVLVNLVAIQPNGFGNFQAYATGTTPTGGVLNFSLLTPPVNNSNAIIVPIDPSGDMDLFVNSPALVGVDAVHARGVILGYYS